MDTTTFNRLREIVYAESGIALGEEKRALVENRVGKRLRALRVADEGEYLRMVELDVSGEELVQLIDAISTNVTYFYRERAHFDFLAQWLDQRAGAGANQVRIWCAASSSGEEPYTICMTAAEHLDLQRVRFQLLATDICTRVLKLAVAGRYSAKQFKDAPPEVIKRYTQPVKGTAQPVLEVAPSLRELVTFKKLNLSKFPLPLQGPIDIIFCRNVMIYFDLALRATLVAEFYRLLPPGGYLIVGHSENLLGIRHEFHTVQTGIYRRER